VLGDDLDGDGRRDVLVLAEDRVLALSAVDGRRLAAFGEPDKLPPRRVALLGDVDGDGVGDLVLGCPDASCSERNLAHVDVISGKTGARIRRLADGNGMFGSEVAGGSDLDGDGRPEIAVATHSMPWEGVRVYSGRTGAQIQGFANGDMDCHRQFSVAFVPDVDGDGVDELAIGATTWVGANCDDGSVTLWSGKTGALLHTWTAATVEKELAERKQRAPK
jgi:hypothetical protein